MTDRSIHVPANSGASLELRVGEVLTVTARTIVDLVAFDLHDVTHRFDQARTKANQGKIFVTTGDVLISKRNQEMLRIVEDGFTEGHHDLQYGMCNPDRWKWAAEAGIASATYLREDNSPVEFPDHGCYENIMSGLAGYPISGEDVPAPFNLFQNMDIDGVTGSMKHTKVRPSEPTNVRLLALMDCLVAVSACPDLLAGGREVQLTVTAS
jgi:uncharacterized protein YcgI (DUF1989 family)